MPTGRAEAPLAGLPPDSYTVMRQPSLASAIAVAAPANPQPMMAACGDDRPNTEELNFGPAGRSLERRQRRHRRSDFPFDVPNIAVHARLPG